MCRLTLFIIICEVVLVKAVEQVQGHFGDTITLSSGADPSWTLTKIEWSVFYNSTWIATLHQGRVHTNRFYLYKGRLSLNITSGDLTIRNLTTTDDLLYNIEVLNSENRDNVQQIQLTVIHRLKIPTIQTVKNESRKENCVIELKCSSPEKGVAISWNVLPTLNTVTRTTSGGTVSHILAYLDITTGFVDFTCTSSRKKTDISGVAKIQAKCNEHKPQPSTQPPPLPLPPPPQRDRNGLSFVTGFFAGCVITGIIVFYLGGQIKTAWQHLLEKLRAPKDSS